MLNQLIGQKCLSVSLPVWDAASSEVGAEPFPCGAVAGCPHPLLWVQAALRGAVGTELPFPPQLSWGWCLV